MSSMNTDVGIMSLQHQQPCCNLGISRHMDLWKNIILIAPDKTRDILLSLALGLVLAFGYSWFSFRHHPFTPHPHMMQLRIYKKENPDLFAFYNLKLAFARGILNPKVF